MGFVDKPLGVQCLSGGVFISTMTPFDDSGELLTEEITSQVKLLATVPGVQGVAIHKSERERGCLSVEERLTAIAATRQGLRKDQLLFVCIDELCENTPELVVKMRRAGANAVVSFAANDVHQTSSQERTARWSRLTENLALPIIMALGQTNLDNIDHVTSLARECDQILGVELGDGDDVLQYDQAYFALKALDRPIAVLAASQGALFHNLNTGGDGVLSCLASIMPHEVVELYRAAREGRFYDAQAIHTKILPLVNLLRGQDVLTRELIYRKIAVHRGLMSTAHARIGDRALSTETIDAVAEVQAELRLSRLS